MEPRLNLQTNEFSIRAGKRFAGVSLLIQQSTLPQPVQDLVMIRASQLNGCGFCLDFHPKDAAVAGETALRLNLVAAWRETTVFTEAERAALALTEEGTQLTNGVSDETWADVGKHYDEEQTAALVYLVATINAANRLGVITRTQGGSYQPAQDTAKREANGKSN